MSLLKFMVIALLLTMVSLGYVYQQAELLRINYNINYNKDDLSVLLDRNSSLMYNVNSLQSPLYVQQRLVGQEELEWEIPSHWHTIGLAEAAK